MSGINLPQLQQIANRADAGAAESARRLDQTVPVHRQIVPAGTAGLVLVYVSGTTNSQGTNLGGGVYSTKSVATSSAAFNPTTTTFTLANLGTAAATYDSYGLNLREIGASTHVLLNASNTTQFLFLAQDWMNSTDGLPVRILLGPAFWAKVCT